MSNKEKAYKAYGLLSALALELIILIIISLYLGRWLEDRFGLWGLAVPTLIFMSMGLWVYLLVNVLSKLEKDERSEGE